MLNGSYRIICSSPSAGSFKYLVQFKNSTRILHNESHRGTLMPMKNVLRKGFGDNRAGRQGLSSTTTSITDITVNLDDIQNIDMKYDSSKRVKDSLEFLLGPGSAPIQNGYFEEIMHSKRSSKDGQLHKENSHITYEDSNIDSRALNSEKSTNRAIVEYTEWQNQTNHLMNTLSWTELTEFLRTTSVSGSIDETYIKTFLSDLINRHQYVSVLYLFDEFEDRVLAKDSQAISFAIKASLVAKKHDYCDHLYEKYSSLHTLPIETLENVLKSFIRNYNFTEARAFLHQIWPQARENTIISYITGAVQVARNPQEIMDVYHKWKSFKDGVSGKIYSLVLGGLYDLESWTDLESVLRDACESGKMNDPYLLGISIGRSLEVGNWKKAEEDLLSAQNSGIVVPRKPFYHAANYMALRGNDEGVAKCSYLFVQAGHPITVSLLNAIGSGYSQFNKEFDVVKYLNSWNSHNIQGDVRTIRWIIAHFERKNKRLSIKLKEKLFDILRKCPHLLSNFYVYEMDHLPDQSSVYNHAQSTKEYMKRMQQLISAGKIERAFAHLDDLLRRRIRPPKPCFYLLIRELGSRQVWGPTNWLLEMMEKLDYSLENDTQLKLLQLQKELYSKRSGPENSADKHKVRQEARGLVERFFGENHELLTLEGRTTLAMEAMRFRLSDLAISLIDSKRAGGRFTLCNHDDVSISELTRSYKQSGDYNGAYRMILTVINDEWKGMFSAGFFRQLKRLIRKAETSKEQQWAENLKQLISRCNIHNEMQEKKAFMECDAIGKLLMEWDQALDKKGDNHVNK